MTARSRKAQLAGRYRALAGGNALASRWMYRLSPPQTETGEDILRSLSISERRLRLFAISCFRSPTRAAGISRDFIHDLNQVEQYLDGHSVPDESRTTHGFQRIIPADGTEAARIAADVAESEEHSGLDRQRERGYQGLLLVGIAAQGWRFSTSWRTDTALPLARQMYDSRDFSAMPILADALQDAGCDSEDWLTVMREGTWPWCRGCRIIDDLLGLR